MKIKTKLKPVMVLQNTSEFVKTAKLLEKVGSASNERLRQETVQNNNKALLERLKRAGV